MEFIFAILFFVFSVYFGILDVKKRKLTGMKKFTTIFLYLYFGISMCLFATFTVINSLISMFIFLHLIFIIAIYMLIDKKNLFVACNILIICIIGMSLCVFSILDYNIDSKMLWTVLVICAYLLPACVYFDRKRTIARKIENCTEKVEAKIIKVFNDRTNGRVIYIPKFEFYLNGKKYKFMDNSEIFFHDSPQVGDTVMLFVNPNNPNFSSPNGCDDVLFPNPIKENRFKLMIVFWYIFPLTILALVLIINKLN